ncbi:hypothetical protein PFISCL1PPCAC_6352 [Pristionchus fissidentatus]|uniref:Amidase domain-containing protein n=1 Tax=Pristionchus fissidentatus TaxID=1538716 RepID=A0AAV5V925_9BILA|nr:hypothetical protein PFISCL1PPCAC_6352 [Pristionchus fissidentatus]
MGHGNSKADELEAHSEVARKERKETIEWAKEQAKLASDDVKEKISKMDFRQLRDALQKGEVSAESVMRVYYGLAVASHEKTNCLTVIIKDSLDTAKSLDEKAKDASYKKPSLFGMPISVKDAVDVAGSRSTWGMASRVDNIPKEDAFAVMRVREAGMIPFCKTNVPTSCMTYNCCNSIYGTTNTPSNPDRSSGGSSGGEGALLSTHGSIIGLGSDIGGSVRIPAAYSGCCGFKPSATRFSLHQYHEPVPFRPVVMPTEGPMAQDPHAITELLRVIWSDRYIAGHDPQSVPVDFREDLFKEGRKYRIGHYTSDGYIEALSGNQRVVREAVEVLKSKGHTLVPFSMDDIVGETMRGAFTVGFADGGARQAEVLKDEPLPEMVKPLRDFGNVPLWKKRFWGCLARRGGDTPTADFLQYLPKYSMEVQLAIDRVYACRKKLIQKMKDESIDCLLCPATLSPALPHATTNIVPFTAIVATIMWNAMDFPAGIVTTGSWNENDEKELENYEEKGMVEKTIKKECKNSIGLPLAVQIVAPVFRDEMVLRLMCDLFDANKK